MAEAADGEVVHLRAEAYRVNLGIGQVEAQRLAGAIEPEACMDTGAGQRVGVDEQISTSRN